MSLLEVDHLKTEFRTRDGIARALNGVSFHVDAGETLAIVGESGSGKSCCMLSVLRLIEPPGTIVGGTVRFAGRDLLTLGRAAMRAVRGNEIAMVFQDPLTALNPLLTVGRQIGEVLQLHLHLDRRQARARAGALLDLVGIPEAQLRLDSYPHQLSGGMRQRVMIAMGLACAPKLLIADEPTTALDVTIQAQIIDLVKRLRAETGMAVIWITHDLGVVAGLADRVLVMYAGRVVEEATVEELYAAPRHPYTIGLLASLPRLDALRADKLASIEGAPPDIINAPPGCAFAPRCTYAKAQCLQEAPELTPVGLAQTVKGQHRVACWVAAQSTVTVAEKG